MFANHSKSIPVFNSLNLAPDQVNRASAVPAGPACTCSHARSAEEKLTGVLIILSILALILTF